MLTIGLTGGIGSGKTTVSDLFEKLGVYIIDTDVIAKELVINNQSVLQELTDTFGEAIIDSDGHLDRKKLAHIVFNQTTEKQRLEKILHPKIRSEVARKIQQYNTDKSQPDYLLVVIPLLIETGFSDLIDRTLVVLSSEENRIKRVINRDDRNIAEIQSIINSQVTDEKRISCADDIIENNNNIKELESKVRQLHDRYIQLSDPDG